MYKKIIADFFKSRRLRMGLSQTQMGRLLDVPQQHIGRLEDADYNTTIEVIGKMLDKLGFEIKIVRKKNTECPLRVAKGDTVSHGTVFVHTKNMWILLNIVNTVIKTSYGHAIYRDDNTLELYMHRRDSNKMIEVLNSLNKVLDVSMEYDSSCIFDFVPKLDMSNIADYVELKLKYVEIGGRK